MTTDDLVNTKIIPDMLTHEEVRDKLMTLPGDRVTKEYMESRIAQVDYQVMHGTVTLCSILLDNGYSVRGESACVDPINYRKDIGESIAYRNAFDKLWPLFGFLLAETIYQRSAKKDVTHEDT